METGTWIQVIDPNFPEYNGKIGVVIEVLKNTLTAEFEEGEMILLKRQVRDAAEIEEEEMSKKQMVMSESESESEKEPMIMSDEEDVEDLILLDGFEAYRKIMMEKVQALKTSLDNWMIIFLEITHEPYPSVHYYKDKLPMGVYGSDAYKTAKNKSEYLRRLFLANVRDELKQSLKEYLSILEKKEALGLVLPTDVKEMIQREGAKATFASARVQRNRVLYKLFQMVLMYGEDVEFPDDPYPKFMELAKLMMAGKTVSEDERQKLRALIPWTATPSLMPVFEYFADNEMMREAKWDREFLKYTQGQIDMHNAEEEDYYFRHTEKIIPEFEKKIALNTATLERLKTRDAPFAKKEEVTVLFGSEYSGLFAMPTPRPVARNESFCFVISNKEDMDELCLKHVQSNRILGTNVFPEEGKYKQQYAGFNIKIGGEDYNGGEIADDAFTNKKRYTCHRLIEKNLFQVVAFFEPVTNQLCMVFVTPLPVLNMSKQAQDKLEELINLQRQILGRLRQQQAYNDYDPYDDPGLKNYLVPDVLGRVIRKDLDLSTFDQGGELFNDLLEEHEYHTNELAMIEKEEARSKSLAKKTIEELAEYFKKFENDQTQRWAHFSVKSMSGKKRITKEEAIANAFEKLKKHEKYAIKYANEKYDNLNKLNDFMLTHPEYPYTSAVALYNVYLQGIKRLHANFTLYEDDDRYLDPVYNGDLNELKKEYQLLEQILKLLHLFWRDDGHYYGRENNNIAESRKAFEAAGDIKATLKGKK